jgi:transcriptional regulator with XRE-family HTH domain
MARRAKTPLELDIQSYDNQSTFDQEALATTFMADIAVEMERMDLSKADLALILDLNRSQVSRLFNKPGNPTLRTLVDLATAVDHQIEIRLRPVRVEELPVHPNVVPPSQWLTWLRDASAEQCDLGWAKAGSNK